MVMFVEKSEGALWLREGVAILFLRCDFFLLDVFLMFVFKIILCIDDVMFLDSIIVK